MYNIKYCQYWFIECTRFEVFTVVKIHIGIVYVMKSLVGENRLFRGQKRLPPA
jgi:hypothetical protein